MTFDELKALVAQDVNARSATLGQRVFIRDTIDAMWDRLGGNAPHKVTFTEDGWTLAHPLTCRIQEGGLLACPIAFDEPLTEGLGTYDLLDGEWVREVD